MSSSSNAFAGQLIVAGTPALAAMAMEELFARSPACRERYQPGAEAKWRRNLESRLADLVAALAAGHERLFIDQAAWAKAAFVAHAGAEAVDDLRASLAALADVLEREMPGPAARPAVAMVRRAVAELPQAPDYIPSRLTADSPHGRLAAKYLLSILEGDRHAAAGMILDAALGRNPELPPPAPSPRELFESVLLPVQEELGRMWHMNESTVGEEHFATSTTQMVVSLLYPYHHRKPRNGLTVVSGSVDGNAHEIGVRMLSDLLEADGWRVIYLGASVPADDFAQAVLDFGADVAAVSASLATQLPEVARTVRAIRKLSNKPFPVLVGGSGFIGAQDAWRSTEADAYAPNLAEGLAAAERLGRTVRPNVP